MRFLGGIQAEEVPNKRDRPTLSLKSCAGDHKRQAKRLSGILAQRERERERERWMRMQSVAHPFDAFRLQQRCCHSNVSSKL